MNIQRLPGEFVRERLRVQTDTLLYGDGWGGKKARKEVSPSESLEEAGCRHAGGREGKRKRVTKREQTAQRGARARPPQPVCLFVAVQLWVVNKGGGSQAWPLLAPRRHENGVSWNV